MPGTKVNIDKKESKDAMVELAEFLDKKHRVNIDEQDAEGIVQAHLMGLITKSYGVVSNGASKRVKK